jgi:hypothetical protein
MYKSATLYSWRLTTENLSDKTNNCPSGNNNTCANHNYFTS